MADVTLFVTCNICNKVYKNKNSLGNHNRKFHKNPNVEKCSPNVEKCSLNVQYCSPPPILKLSKCDYCDKVFNCRSTKSKHRKKCYEKYLANEEIKKQQLKEKEEKEKEKYQLKMMKLKLKLENCSDLDTKTFKSVNKMLMNKSFKNSINTNSNNVNSMNTINNTHNQINHHYNNIIIEIGKENLLEVLSNNEKMQIMNSKFESLHKIVQIAHCGNHDNFKNIVITNLKDDYAYTYNKEKGYFVTVTKTKALNTLMTHRLGDLEEIYHELSEAKKVGEQTKKILEEFIEKINEDEDTINYVNKNITILLYNNRDKITKDLALLIGNKDAAPVNAS
jgi:hypothetical protein